MKKILTIFLMILFSATVFSFDSNNYASEVVRLVNRERKKENLSPLSEDKFLNALAVKKARLIGEEGKLSHTAGGYSSFPEFLKSHGVKYWAAGENIAMNHKTPEEVMTGWMNSRGHRANILNDKYTNMGVGKYIDDKNNIYWVQIFIKERKQ